MDHLFYAAPVSSWKILSKLRDDANRRLTLHNASESHYRVSRAQEAGLKSERLFGALCRPIVTALAWAETVVL